MPATTLGSGLPVMQSKYVRAVQPLGPRAKRCIWQLVMLLVFSNSVVLRAADAQPAADPNAATSGEQASAPANPQTSATAEDSDKTSEKDSVFRPSEDISEDLAVPFPVDI